MIQKVNGETVLTKPVHVPSYEEIEQARRNETPIELMIAFCDGAGGERTGFLVVSKITSLKCDLNGGFSFGGRIDNVNLLLNESGDDSGVVFGVDTGLVHVKVDSLGESIAFSITVRFQLM